MFVWWTKKQRRQQHPCRLFLLPPTRLPPALILTFLPFYGLPRRLKNSAPFKRERNCAKVVKDLVITGTVTKGAQFVHFLKTLAAFVFLKINLHTELFRYLIQGVIKVQLKLRHCQLTLSIVVLMSLYLLPQIKTNCPFAFKTLQIRWNS